MTKNVRKNHGQAGGRAAVGRTALYSAWAKMRERCNNPRHNRYKFYGGRGIKVCTRWDRFAAFAADVGPHPGKGWSLDRVDVDGNYEPGNVRWADSKMQARNRNYCKLTAAAALAMRAEYAQGATQVTLAGKYGVTQATVSLVVRGETWR